MNMPRTSHQTPNAGNGILSVKATAKSNARTEVLLARAAAIPSVTSEQAFRILEDCGATILPAYHHKRVFRCWHLKLGEAAHAKPNNLEKVVEGEQVHFTQSEIEFYLRVDAQRKSMNGLYDDHGPKRQNSLSGWMDGIRAEIEVKVSQYFKKTHGMEFDVFKALVSQPHQPIVFDFEVYAGQRIVLGAYFPQEGLLELHKIAGSFSNGINAARDIAESYSEASPRSHFRDPQANAKYHRELAKQKGASPQQAQGAAACTPA